MCARLCEWRQEMRCVSRLGKSETNGKSVTARGEGGSVNALCNP